MAELFGVSPQAMSYRLQDLGLLDERGRCELNTDVAPYEGSQHYRGDLDDER